MTILDAITSSPINVFFTIVIGIGLAYLYYRKPSSSSSSTGTQSSAAHNHNRFPNRAFLHNHSGYTRPTGLDNGAGVVDEELQRAIAQIERQERNMIRQEQDEAYQQSLKADREKKLKREEEQRDREAKERAERERKEKIELLHQRLTKLKSEITDKLPFNKTTTEASSNDDIIKFVFKLPDGTRVKQDFRKQDKVKYLHWFVFSLKNAPLQFRLTTNFPKRDLPGRPPMPEDFEPSKQEETKSPVQTTSSSNPVTPTNTTLEPNCELTLAEAGLTETQIIFVYDLEA
uniref:FAS-associated factor 2-B n=1 Tax=Aceria tosichella TaxID=561515 RepID=A0A6G1SL21_9ACAR